MRRSSSTRRGAVLAATAFAAFGWTAWQELWAHGGDTPVRWLDVTSRTLAQPPDAGLRVFQQQDALVRALTSGGRSATVPSVDFGEQMAILVSSGPRSSTAYELEVVAVIEERRRLVVKVREQTPSLREPGVAALSFPFRLITVERRGKPVTLEWEGRP